MGIADVIPGVSGGTLALILGVYKELVDSIRGLSPKFLWPALRFAKTRDAADRAELIEELRKLNLPFLITLGAGIFFAIALGSLFIPHLMENYPAPTKAFFFGLIIASVWVPFRMIGIDGSRTASVAAVSAVIGIALGWVLTNPASTYESTREWFEVTAEQGDTLKDVTRHGPSALPSADVFWAQQNEALRASVQASDPQAFAKLAQAHDAEAGPVTEKSAIKARSAPYDELVITAGTPVKVPRPQLWFVFVSGLIAICAMILPGISGSYILLILGNYFFILNALKGFLSTAAHLSVPWNQSAYVIVFCAGCAIGLLSFSRVLSYLLRERPVPTLGVLVGLMIGCLRGIWPFQATVDSMVVNVLPPSLDAAGGAIATCLAGFAVVVAFTWMSGRGEVAA